MKVTEIFPLTGKAVAKLLASREAAKLETEFPGRRKALRWPFPGVVELWIPAEEGGERHALATSLNLSLFGIGIRCDEWLSHGLELAIAFHEPEASLHGRAVVRHCTQRDGEYLIGLEFFYDDE